MKWNINKQKNIEKRYGKYKIKGKRRIIEGNEKEKETRGRKKMYDFSPRGDYQALKCNILSMQL